MPVLLAILASGRIAAQDDPNEVPLGDVARNLRKKTPPAKPVIDDDNLPQVMEQGEKRQGFGASLKYLMGGQSSGFQVAAPDVTCNLAFTANVKSLLSGQYSQMDLPATELAKLEGPATIEGDALTVTVFNGTNWHLSEVDVAVTVIHKPGSVGGQLSGLSTDGIPDGQSVTEGAFQDVRPEKTRDVSVIYRMRAAAAPWMRVVFSARLNIDLAPGDEWHWGIVQAKGYPPEAPTQATSAAFSGGQAVTEPTSVSAIPQSNGPSPGAQNRQ